MRSLLLALVAMLLIGCSSKPGDAEVEGLVRQALLADGGSEILSVENFQRTNGYAGQNGAYVVEVAYDVVYKKSLRELQQSIGKDAKATWFQTAGAQVQVMMLAAQYGDFPAGHRVQRTEKLTLIKTEKGWRLSTN